MRRYVGTLILAVMFGLASSSAFADDVANGNWKLDTVRGGSELSQFIIKLENKDGKLSGEMMGMHPAFKGSKVQTVELSGGRLRIVIKGPGGEELFDGAIAGENTKSISGSHGSDGQIFPATLTLTEMTTIDPKTAFHGLPVQPLQKATTLSNQTQFMRAKAQQTKDKEKRAELLEAANKAIAEAKPEIAKLYQEVVDNHSDSPAVFAAVLNLLSDSTMAKPESAKKWAETASKAAKAYGPRLQLDIDRQLAAALGKIAGMEPLAIQYAQQAAKGLDVNASPSQQVSVLGVLAKALVKAGKTDEAAVIRKRIANLDNLLDAEYMAKVPSFKGTPYAGRESKSDRVAVMELFTGAQCPPCVAADVAFDVLQRTYKATDLVLIQYHLHIPGPDPLTNADTEARWQYYVDAYPGKVGGVPTAFFNGGAPVVGGGPMASSESRYGIYQKLINPLLEKPATAKVAAQAARDGDKISIQVEVLDLASPGEDMKLRLALVEETVRYAGGNKIRFHHQVVRAMPGGAAGVALKDKASKHTFTVDLAERRNVLTKYLDDYVANNRAFSPDERPLDLGNLRVIALIQDDASHEILQATQIDVGERKNAR